MRTSGAINIAACARRLDVDNRISLRDYYRIADNLLKQADIYRAERNVIDLYIMLLRFASLVTETIPFHKDYRFTLGKEKMYFKTKLLKAMSELEGLQPVVQNRIEELNRKRRGQVNRREQKQQNVVSTFSPEDYPYDRNHVKMDTPPMSAAGAGASTGNEEEELPLSHPSAVDLEVYPDNSGEQDGGVDGLVEVRVGGGLRPEAGPARVVDGGGALEYEVDCPICLAPWTEDGPHQPCSLACGHTFGRMCLENWICKWKKNACPKCKRQCDVDDIRPIYPPRVAVICNNSLKDFKLSSLQTTEYMEFMQAEIDDIKMQQTSIVQTLHWGFRYMPHHGGLSIASSSNHALGDPASVSADLNEVPIYALRDSASVSTDIDEDPIHVLNVSDSASAEMDDLSVHALGDSASVSADIDEVPIHALGDSSSASAKMSEAFVHALGDSSSASANTDEVPVRSIGDLTSDGANMDEAPIRALGNPASDSANMD